MGISGDRSERICLSSCKLFMGSQGKNTEVVCHSLLQWTAFCHTSPPWPIRLEWPYMAWLSFIELDKAVVHVIKLANCLCLRFQSVGTLMPSFTAYCLTWVSLTLDVGYLFMAAPAKHSHCSLPWTWDIYSSPRLLTLDMGYLLSASVPDFGHGVSPHGQCSYHSCAAQPLLLLLLT